MNLCAPKRHCVFPAPCHMLIYLLFWLETSFSCMSDVFVSALKLWNLNLFWVYVESLKTEKKGDSKYSKFFCLLIRSLLGELSKKF